MHPILAQFTIFSRQITIGTYGVFMVFAIACAVLIMMKAARRADYFRDDLIPALIIIITCGLTGTMIAGIAVYFIGGNLSFTEYLRSPVVVSWGGIAGGIIAGIIVCIAWKIDIARLADIIAPGYLLGIGIGRIGCFFGGCCYGVHTDSVIGITFTDSFTAASQCIQPLVPTQLISAVYLIIVGLLFFIMAGKTSVPGRLFALSALVYSAGRFTIEFWRDDTRVFLFSLSDGQIFSIIFFASGLVIILYQVLTKK